MTTPAAGAQRSPWPGRIVECRPETLLAAGSDGSLLRRSPALRGGQRLHGPGERAPAGAHRTSSEQRRAGGASSGKHEPAPLAAFAARILVAYGPAVLPGVTPRWPTARAVVAVAVAAVAAPRGRACARTNRPGQLAIRAHPIRPRRPTAGERTNQTMPSPSNWRKRCVFMERSFRMPLHAMPACGTQSSQPPPPPGIPPRGRASRVQGMAPRQRRRSSGDYRVHGNPQRHAGAARWPSARPACRRAAARARACWPDRGRRRRAGRPAAAVVLHFAARSAAVGLRGSAPAPARAPACLSTLVNASCAMRSSCSAACGDRLSDLRRARRWSRPGATPASRSCVLPAEQEVAQGGAEVVSSGRQRVQGDAHVGDAVAQRRRRSAACPCRRAPPATAR